MLALSRHCAESPVLFMYRTPDSLAPPGTSNTIQPLAHWPGLYSRPLLLG